MHISPTVSGISLKQQSEKNLLKLIDITVHTTADYLIKHRLFPHSSAHEPLNHNTRQSSCARASVFNTEQTYCDVNDTSPRANKSAITEEL